MGAKSSYWSTSHCYFHRFNTFTKIIYYKRMCAIQSPRAVNYETRLNGMPGCVPERTMGTSRQISKWDESVEHLAGPCCIGFHPPRHDIKRLVGGLSVDARPTSTRRHEHQYTALKYNWTTAPQKHTTAMRQPHESQRNGDVISSAMIREAFWNYHQIRGM